MSDGLTQAEANSPPSAPGEIEMWVKAEFERLAGKRQSDQSDHDKGRSSVLAEILGRFYGVVPQARTVVEYRSVEKPQRFDAMKEGW